MKKILISSLVATAILCGGSSVAFASTSSNSNISNQNTKIENKIDDATVKYNHDHLNYSIEEMRKAATIFDNKDLTNDENYLAMITFARGSLDRVRSLDIYNNTENWNSKTFSWAKDAEDNMSWIEETGNKINDATYRINRVLEAMDNVKLVFAPERQGQESNINKHNVITTLNLVLTQEYKDGVINQTTLRNAVTFMYHYNNLIK